MGFCAPTGRRAQESRVFVLGVNDIGPTYRENSSAHILSHPGLLMGIFLAAAAQAQRPQRERIVNETATRK